MEVESGWRTDNASTNNGSPRQDTDAAVQGCTVEHCQNKSIGFMLFLEFLFAVLLLCRRRQEASVWQVGWLQQQQQRQLVVA